jgi:hypothetical protein
LLVVSIGNASSDSATALRPVSYVLAVTRALAAVVVIAKLREMTDELRVVFGPQPELRDLRRAIERLERKLNARA